MNAFIKRLREEVKLVTVDDKPFKRMTIMLVVESNHEMTASRFEYSPIKNVLILMEVRLDRIDIFCFLNEHLIGQIQSELIVDDTQFDIIALDHLMQLVLERSRVNTLSMIETLQKQLELFQTTHKEYLK
jgi:hypothetical protein